MCAEARMSRIRFCMETAAALKQSNTHLWRVGLALAMTIKALALLFGGEMGGDLKSTTTLRGLAPLCVWAGLTTIAAGLQWWRLLDHKARVDSLIYVNVYVTLLLLFEAGLMAFDTGFVVGAESLVLLLASIWLTLRSGFTHLDKSQA